MERPMETTYVCGSCGKGFRRTDNLKKHLLIHTGSRPFQCTWCGKAFREKNHLNSHLLLHTGEKPYKCPHCGKAFNQNSNLKKHIKIHLDDRPYVCNICQNRFTQQCYLNEHMKNHTGERAYKCTDCGKMFKNSSHLRSHRKTHSDERPYKCTLCDKTFKYIRNYSLHIMGHDGDPSCSCSECGRQFLNRNNLNIHMLSHSNVKIHECFVCGKEFHKLDKFKRHLQAHTGERPFKCTVCDDGFKSNSHLKFHMMLHTGEKPFTCEVCGSGFRSKSYLTSHMISHTKTRHRCTLCGKSFKYKCNYTRHVKTHNEAEMQQSSIPVSTGLQQNCSDPERPSYSSPSTGSEKVAVVAHRADFNNRQGTSVIAKDKKSPDDQKLSLVSSSSQGSEKDSDDDSVRILMKLCTDEYPFHCTNCNETFRHESQLEEHLKVHIGSPYQCPVCDAYFRDDDYLQRHMESHKALANKSLEGDSTGAEECRVCGKKFTQAKMLKRHMLIHSNHQTFECKVCQEKFEDESDLKTHNMLHPAPKTHECTMCDKKFVQNINLKRHMRIHCMRSESEDKIYSCNICNLWFCYKHNLETHKMIHVMRETALQNQNQAVAPSGHSEDSVMSDKSIIHTLMGQYFISGSGFDFESGEPVILIIDEQEMEKKENEVIVQSEREYKSTEIKIPRTFENHIESSMPEQKFLCIICGEGFIEQSLLRAHLRQHKLECPQCGKTFNRLNNLKRHMVVHTGMRRYQCYVCGKKFKESGHLKTHFLHLHSEEQALECKSCNKKFVHKSYYQRHIKTNHGDKAPVLVHQNIHVAEEPTRNNEYLQRALENIGNDVRFDAKEIENMDNPQESKYDTVSASFDGDYSNTYKNFHYGKESNYDTVSAYDENYGNNYNSFHCVKDISLKRHIMIHTNEHAYDCHMCGKGYKENEYRDEHEMVHAGVPHPYAICDGKFTQKSVLSGHRKTHDTLYPHDDAESREMNLESDGNFGSIDGRKKSVRIPKGDIEVTKEILCDITEPTVEIQVGKLTVQTISYEAAMKRRQILKERKLHRCPVCNKTFNRKSNLARHAQSHRDDSSVFKCDFCSDTFKNKQLLESHLRSHKSRETSQPQVFRKTPKENKPRGFYGRRRGRNTEDPSAHVAGKKSLVCYICGTKFHFQHHLENHLIIHKLKKKIGKEKKYPVKTNRKKVAPPKIDHEKEDLPKIDHENEDPPNIDQEKEDSSKIIIKSRGNTAAVDVERSKLDLDYVSRRHEEVEDHGESKVIIVKEEPVISDEIDVGEMEVGKLTVKTLPYSIARERRLKERGIKKRVNCSVCGKDFASNYSLKVHMKLHNRGRLYNCSFCDEKFRLRYSLESHISELHRRPEASSQM